MKTLLLSLAMGAAFSAQAATVDVTITNATDGIYFTPLLVATHASDHYLFRTGEAASAEIEAWQKAAIFPDFQHWPVASEQKSAKTPQAVF